MAGQIQEVLRRHALYGQTRLLPALIDVQERSGYLSEEVLAEVAQAFHLPVSQVYAVATYYGLLYTEPVGRRFVRVCESLVCACAGATQVVDALGRRLGVRPGETTPDGEFTLEVVPCLGACDRAPVVLLDNALYTGLDPSQIEGLLTGRLQPAVPGVAATIGGMPRVLTEHAAVTDLHRLERYLERDGFAALRKALDMRPEAIVEEVKASGLVGRGGAAFPTGLKWQLAAQAPGQPKYVVCNADESEPGTFKDRWLLEHNPLAIIEAMAIAGYAVGACQGYIYVRGEYPDAYARLQTAVAEASDAGFLGERVLGRDFAFAIEVRRGAGAYVAGEETALFESIEGKRPMPRNKPPFPTTAGLFGKPTLINNVETLANIPLIIRHGASWFRQWGTSQSPGTRLFCVSGHAARPGIYEVPLGISLRTLIYDLAGGVRNGRPLRAVVLGGAAGTFVAPEQLDVALDFQAPAALGATLGSGAVMVFDDSVDIWEIALNCARFFAHESCGKCFPCQLGTRRQVEILERVQARGARPGDAELLRDIGLTMRDASLCGLGQTAASLVLSAIDLWGVPQERQA
jgi:NADH-quinone oxidoreductase subunit F